MVLGLIILVIGTILGLPVWTREGRADWRRIFKLAAPFAFVAVALGIGLLILGCILHCWG